MLGVVSPGRMRALEQQVMDSGVTESQLIERAANQIANHVDNYIQSAVPQTRSVTAVAGPGNNGVDAIVAASLLAERGWTAVALLVERSDMNEHPELAHHFGQLEIVTEIGQCDVILDGIFGNSGRTELPDTALQALRDIAAAAEQHGTAVFAIDCPTGTNTATGEIADGTVRADVTLCISHPKFGMLQRPALDFVGELIVLDIGIPKDDGEASDMHMIDAATSRALLPSRPGSAHKSGVGGLLIVGGAPGYFGAPRLAGEAALRSGCGYVGLAAPRSIIGAIASAVPELIFHPVSDADGRASATVVRDALSEGGRYDAIVIGPGLGRDEVAERLMTELFDVQITSEEPETPASAFGIPRRVRPTETLDAVDISEFPMVIDADALNWLAGQVDWPTKLAGRVCVLTPHRGEMARLLDVEIDALDPNPWDVVRRAAREWNQVVVLKGGLSCVASPDGELVVAPRLTPELATPGTGDMLAGLIGAFIATGATPFDSACLSLWVGAQAGRIARQELGTRSVVARDVIKRLSAVLHYLESPYALRMETLIS